MSESGLSCFVSRLGDCIPWHAVCLQEAFKRLEILGIPEGHVVYTPPHRPHRGFRVPAVLVRIDVGEDTEVYASGVRCVAVRFASHAAFASCTTERFVLQGDAPRDHVLPQPF